MKKGLRVSCILLLTVLILSANTVFSMASGEGEAASLLDTLTVSDEKNAAYADRLTDGVYGSYVSYAAGDTVSVYGSEPIGYAYVAWQQAPDSKVTLAWLDEKRAVVASEEKKPARLDEYYDAPQEGVYGYRLTFSNIASVSELGAYTAGQLPKELPQFEEPLQKPAVMVVTGYPGDELACFGGLIPSLVNQGVPVQVVYLNPYNRGRQEECLRTLWKLGMKNEPIFLDTTGKRSLDGQQLMDNTKNVAAKLIQAIESCKPSVIVTHGKTRHFPLMAETEMTYLVLTSRMDRIKQFSFLKKIYMVEEKDGKDALTFDFSDGYEQAAALYEEGYASMRTFHYTPYADDVYSLYFTSENKYKEGDMLTNISYTALSTPEPTATPTPEPTAEPTAEPTPEPTAEPTPEPTAEPVSQIVATPTAEPAAAPVSASIATPAPTPMPRQAATGKVMLPILLSLLGAALLFGALVAAKKLYTKQLPVIVGIMAPVLSGLVLFAGLYGAASLNRRQAQAAEQFDSMLAQAAAAAPTAVPKTAAPTPTAVPTPVPTAVPTPVPTAVPTPVPTAEPTAEPTPEPSATPAATADPDGELYTQGQEVVYKDEEAGKWLYKNSTLSIEITRYTGIASKIEFPYYVADIHMRADEFRVGFGYENRNGMTSEDAIKIARRYKAVLMITGDNIKNMDVDKKGILIRDGHVYSNGRKADLMLWHPETKSIELVPKEKITTSQLILADGVENSISFGPILMQSGVKTAAKTLEKNWLYRVNPRVGVGMIEPGHFIVVVGGYRSDIPKAALGWTLTEFSDLMASLGCVDVYNVDGGVSACMIFMGERINKGGTKKNWSQLRPLPDGIIFGYSASVPD